MKHTKLSRMLLFILAMVMTLALAGCFWTETPAEKLEAPTLTVDAAVVSWQPVTGAEKYIVFVNGASSETTETSFSLEGREPGAYDVQVQAVKGEEKATSEVATVKITATLSAPEITLSGNSVSWSAVENATGYEVFVNGESRGTVSGTTYAVLENAVGEYKITVKAIGNDIFFASGLSNELTYTVKEPAPQPTSLAAPVISIEGGILSWSAVADATTYKIIVNGNEAYKTSETTFTLPITLTEGDYTIVVKASAPTNDLRLDSAASNEVNYRVSALSLDAPILPVVTVDGVEYLFGIDPDGYIRVKPYASVTDLSSYMWYLEKVEGSEYYNIKLHNGKYLAWGNTASDGSETMAKVMTEQSTEFQWHIGDRNTDGTFRLFNIGHSQKWSGEGKFEYYYGHKEGVIKFGDNAVAISFVNRDIPFTPLTALSAPVVEMNGATATWSAVENAVGYDVYVNGEKVATQTETTYTLSTYGTIYVVAKADGETHLNSEKSETKAYSLDLTQPILPIIVEQGVKYIIKIDTDGFVKYTPFDGVSDFETNMWYLEKDGEYYNIKLFDGRYLAWEDGKSSGGHETFAVLKDEAGNASLQWHITITDQGDYAIYNVGHSNRWSGGNWQYNYCIWDGVLKFASGPKFTFENRDIPFNPDNKYVPPVVEEPDNESFYAWLYYNDGNQTLAATDADGVVIIGGKYDSVSDYNAYIWYFEAINEGTYDGYYRIKLGDKYLTKTTTNVNGSNGNSAEGQFLALDEGNDAQYWLLVADGDTGFFIYNKTLGTAHKFGEYWGVYKFGGNNSWTFTKTDAPVVTPPACTEHTDANNDYICDDCKAELERPEPDNESFYAWLYYNDGNQTLAAVDENGVVIIGGKYDTVTDYNSYIWYFEAINEGTYDGYYRIMQGGKYLTKATTNVGSGNTAEGQFLALDEGNDAQYWLLVADGDGRFFLYNKTLGTAHKYGEYYGVYKFGGNNSWTFTKTDAPVVTPPACTEHTDANNDYICDNCKAELEKPEPDNESFYAWLYYNDANQTLADINSDGVIIIGAKYDSVTDYNSYIWYFEAINDGDFAGYYMIKLPDGRYLTYADSTSVTNNGHTAATIAADKNEVDAKQYWKLVADGEGKYKLENKHLSNYYSNVYLGEYWGVYKFDGVCTSWVFTKTDAPTETPDTPDTPDTPATLTDIPADSAFSAWLYYNDSNQTLALVNADGIMIRGDKYDTVSDHAGHTFIFEPVDVDGTRYYRIRLGDLYLAKATTTLTGSGSDTAEAQFVAYDAASDAQLWILTKEADAKYYLYNKSVGTAHKYGEWYGVYKFGGNNSWTFNDIKAVESTPPAVEEEESKNFTAWLHYEAKSTVADVNSDGIVVMGASYDSLDDAAKAAHTWTFEYISEGDYAGKYRIKNADGKYLCNTSNDSGESKFDTLDESSTSFIWTLVADGEGKYKLLNQAMKDAWGDVYLGEWYGVYKFNGACGAWIFHDVASI